MEIHQGLQFFDWLPFWLLSVCKPANSTCRVTASLQDSAYEYWGNEVTEMYISINWKGFIVEIEQTMSRIVIVEDALLWC